MLLGGKTRAGDRALPAIASPGEVQFAISIFTSWVIFFQLPISPASHFVASSADLVGTIPKCCLAKATLTASASIALSTAVRSVSRISFGVPAVSYTHLRAHE